MSDLRREMTTTVFTTPKQLREIADALEKKCKQGIWGGSSVVHTWCSEDDRVHVAANRDRSCLD
jgi:hypothetical protein